MWSALSCCHVRSHLTCPFKRNGLSCVWSGYAASLRVLDGGRFASSKSDPCPFGVLGVAKNSSYAAVKKAFVELALQHHPDTSAAEDSDVKNFWRIRTAFESIIDDNGTAVLNQKDSPSETSWTDESLSAWFEQQTGRRLSFSMDLKTQREVAHVANTLSPGGLDRGGMWELAKTVARHEKDGLDGVASPPQIAPGKTTRRRKRR